MERKLVDIRFKFQDPPNKDLKPVIDDFSILHVFAGIVLGWFLGRQAANGIQLGFEAGEIIVSQGNPANRFYEPISNKIADILLTALGIEVGELLRKY